jgi:phosphoribosylanthranilate isomerase
MNGNLNTNYYRLNTFSKMKIKVCGMRDISNIRSLVKLRPDYIGLIFYAGSKRFVNSVDIPLLMEVPEEIKLTGVFVNEGLEIVLEKINTYGLKAVQLHGDESPQYCRSLGDQAKTIEIIKAFGIDDSFDFLALEPYLHVVDFFLFDTKTAGHGGSGKTFNWEILKKYPYQKPYFLSGGIGPENIDEVLEIRDERLHALDLNSRFETEPGLKDISKLNLTFSKLNPGREQEDI